jgi:putative ABC transport system permease protein
LNKQVILANFAKRPVRTSVSMLAVSVEVALILVIVGLVTGIRVETGERTQGVGADIMLQAPGSSLFLGLNSSVMPIAIGERLRELEGVGSVTPVVTQFNSQNGFDVVYGIEEQSFNAVSGGLTFLQGRIFDEEDEIVVDDLYAEAKGIGVGDEVSLLNHTFRVSGVVDNGKGARLYMNITTAQDMMGAPDRASLFFIKLNDPNDTYNLIDRLEAMLPTYPATAMREIVSVMTNASFPALDAFLTVVLSLAVSIGILVIFLSMYTTISERTREIGILRSLGASKGFVIRMILTETFWLCAVGVFAGIALSFAIANGVEANYPTLRILITSDWLLRSIGLALASGLLGALYPSLRASRQDPVEALAYE